MSEQPYFNLQEGLENQATASRIILTQCLQCFPVICRLIPKFLYISCSLVHNLAIFTFILLFLASHATKFSAFLIHVQFPQNEISTYFSHNSCLLKTSSGCISPRQSFSCTNLRSLGIYFIISQIILRFFHFLVCLDNIFFKSSGSKKQLIFNSCQLH